MDRRVVVTGMGAVTPLGNNVEDTWANAMAGNSGVERPDFLANIEYQGHKLPVTIAGTVKNFEPEQWITPKKDIRRMDRFMQFAVAAAHQAWLSSGLPMRLEGREADRAGCIVGAGLGGMNSLLDCYDTMVHKGPRRVSPFFIPMIISNLAPGNISIRYNLRGANWAPTSACSSGGHGIGEAFWHIKSGRADVMVAGGTESTVHPLAISGFAAMHALSTNFADTPTKASRPFEKNRDGFVIGEGAGVLVLEEYEHAKKRGANILCELVGYGSSSDAEHITAPAPEGEGAQRAIREALEMAHMNPDEVGYINAHGTSTPFNDKAESEAIRHVFGDWAMKGLMVSSTKSMMGHLLGGAGGVEAVLSVQALVKKELPPTINCDEPDPVCGPLDFIPHTGRSVAVDAVMSNSFGFGGTNTVLLFRRLR